jgi:DNA repair protein RecO
MILETEAIVLVVRKYSDTSKIAVMFSKEFGKISILAKGAFNAKSKFGGLEPLSYVSISFYKKPSSDLHLLKSIELVKPFNKITKNYDALVSGLVAAEIVNATQKENFENTELFAYFVDFLRMLNENVEFGFSLCVNFLFCIAGNLGYLLDFSFVNEHPQNTNEIKISLSDATEINSMNTHSNKNNSNYYQRYFSFRFATISKIANFDCASIDKRIALTNSEFAEIVNFFSTFFEFHLDKKIQIRTLGLLC